MCNRAFVSRYVPCLRVSSTASHGQAVGRCGCVFFEAFGGPQKDTPTCEWGWGTTSHNIGAHCHLIVHPTSATPIMLLRRRNATDRLGIQNLLVFLQRFYPSASVLPNNSFRIHVTASNTFDTHGCGSKNGYIPKIKPWSMEPGNPGLKPAVQFLVA